MTSADGAMKQMLDARPQDADSDAVGQVEVDNSEITDYLNELADRLQDLQTPSAAGTPCVSADAVFTCNETLSTAFAPPPDDSPDADKPAPAVGEPFSPRRAESLTGGHERSKWRGHSERTRALNAGGDTHQWKRMSVGASSGVEPPVAPIRRSAPSGVCDGTSACVLYSSTVECTSALCDSLT